MHHIGGCVFAEGEQYCKEGLAIMKRSRFWEKTLSMVLVCAMLGSTFAQCAIAEEAFETEVVVESADPSDVDAVLQEEPETEAAAVETAEEPATEGQAAEAADEVAPEVADTAVEDDIDEVIDIPEVEEQYGDGAVVVTEIEPMLNDSGIATISATSGDFIYESDDSGDGVRILGLQESFDTTKTDLVIPQEINTDSGLKTVTEIANGAFQNKAQFTGTLTLPNSLEKIGNNAFNGCKFTGSLSLSGTVTEIGENAFSGCCFTGSLSLPTGLEKIAAGTFAGCGFTESLTIPAKVSSIGASAFKGCSGFTGVTLQPGAGLSIGESAFEGCSGLKGMLTIPAGVSEIDASAFKGCSGLTALDLSSFGGTEIAASAFEGCSGMAGTLTIPDGVETIENKAFYGCVGFTALTLGSVTEIGDSAFEGCTGLKDLTLSDELTKIGRRAFYGCSGFATKNLSFPVSLTEISEQAFYGCSGFTGDLDLSGCENLKVGSAAFDGCSGFNGVLKLPADTSGIAVDAIFTSIRMADGDSAVEAQVGGNTPETLKVLAGNSQLDVSNLSTWESSDNTIATVTNGNVKAVKAGTVTVTATVTYNGKKATKNVVVTDSNGAPILKSVSLSKTTVMKPGTLDLTMSVTESGIGIKTVSGYFFQTEAPAQKISFTFDWTKSPKFTGTISGEALRMSVPSSAATGAYHLGGVTLTDMAGKSAAYTYDAAAKKWKNGSGNVVSVTETTDLTVKDAFGAGESKLYITNDTAITNKLNSLTSASNTAVVIQYDGNNHTVKKDWFTKIKGKDVTLVLTNGTVEWCFYGKDITGTVKDIDCLGSPAKADTSMYGNTAASMGVQFAAANGALPGKATVRILASQMNSLYQQTGKLFMYTQNTDETLNKSGTLSYIQSSGQYWYEFELTDCSKKLLMSSKELNLQPTRKVTSIKLNKSTLVLVKGKTYTLKATVGPSYAANKAVKWKSSNTKVATVNSSGKIRTKKYGKVTITATAKDGSGVVAKCKLTVGYKIKYKLNGGTNNKSNPKAYYKTAITLKKPTRKGYKFKGWYTDKNFKNKITKIPKSYKRNLTLYAKWKKK